MADKVSIAPPSRPEIELRRRPATPSVVSRPISVVTPGISIGQDSTTDDLLRSLNISLAKAQDGTKEVMKEEREAAYKEGQLARQKNQEDYAVAVDKGLIPQGANPWFVKGYQEQDGRVSGHAYYTELRKAYNESGVKGSDDPKAYDEFIKNFNKSYMAGVGKDKTTDWWSGFSQTSNSAQATMASEHAQEAEKAAIAKQEANTGAELNVILNGTNDPKAAAEAINALALKVRAEGMPAASFDKVAAEAILAKAKLGNGRMLETLDYVKSGDSKGTLASNPKVTMAKVDVSNFLTEKARGDTRWAWAQQDRQFNLESQARTRQAWQREDERWSKQKDSWDKESKATSILSQIVLNTMSDPANAFVNNKDRIGEIAKFAPEAAEKAASFIDGFLTRRERVPDAKERPVLAQLNSDMVNAAGDPKAQQALIKRAIDSFNAGDLSRDSMARFIDDATRFAAFDPSQHRKLQSPEVKEVKQAVDRAFMDGKATSLYGSKAIDALVVNQSIDKAMIEHLERNPNANAGELADVATKALLRALPTLEPNVMGSGRAADLGAKAGTAARTLQQQQPQDGNTPPTPAPLTPDQAVNSVDPVDAQAFARSVEEALSTGGYPAMLKTIGDFDARVGIPGLGAKLLEKYATPAKPGPKKQ